MSEPVGTPVAFVVGAGGGIGRAIVERLAGDGISVIGFDTVSAPAGVSAEHWIEGDATDDGAVRDAIAEIGDRFGRIDTFIHAAGISRDRVVWKLTPEDWDEVLSVNLRSAFLGLRHVVPVMRAGGGGSIVLIGSINGERGKFGLTAYGASKAGLIGLAKSAARETGRFGVRVNVVEPGMVMTPLVAGLPEEMLDAARDETLLGRIAEPEDIAGTVSFLAGTDSKHITGQVIRVDGGQYL